mgnify:CR=1 FL=1
MIDIWFIDKIAILVEMEEALKSSELTPELLREAKRLEFPDMVIAGLCGKTEREIYLLRKEYGIPPIVYYLQMLLDLLVCHSHIVVYHQTVYVLF